MDLTPVRAVAFDLDGTLAESKVQMTPVMADLFRMLMGRMQIAVMTGGAWSLFEKQVLAALPRDAHYEALTVFTASASSAYVFKDGAWMKSYEYLISPEDRERILSVLHEGMKVTGFEHPPYEVWGERIDDRGSQITFSGLGQLAPPGVKKTWDPDAKIRGPLRDYLRERLPGFSVRTNAYTSIDITYDGFNKAYGVQKFVEFTHIPVEHMLYVGDGLFEGGNDAVVKETGIPTHAVTGPAETANVIEALLTV